MNCIVCGNDSFKLFAENSNLSLPVFLCKICGLYVTGDSENIVKEKLHLLYKGEYWKEDEIKRYVDSDYTDVDSVSKKRQWVSQYEYCKSHLKDKADLLEIGVGGGQATFLFDKKGFNVTGIEPDSKNVELINQKLTHGKCFVGFIEDFEIKKKFDVIWMSHVFEHLVRPDLLLEKLQRGLNDDGVIFIEVPNCENQIIRDLSIDKNPSTYHFSKKSLIKICQNAGYEIISCDCFRSPTIFEGAINKVVSYLTGKNYFKFYPKLIANGKNGTDVRIILRLDSSMKC